MIPKKRKTGVLTIHATHRDLLLIGYAHVQTHSFFVFVLTKGTFSCYNV